MFAVSFDEKQTIDEVYIVSKEKKRRPSDFDVQVSKYDFDSADWLASDVVWEERYTDNTQELLTISIDPPVQAKCIKITIYSTWGIDEGECDGWFENEDDCAAALDEVQVYAIP